MLWAKDLAASYLGAMVYAAIYDGAGWGVPIEVTPDVDFNKDTAVVFDSGGVLMAVWSSASNDGLNYEESSVEEILNAMENADLIYAQRLGGEWSSPEPLAILSGRDEQVSLSPGPDGEIIAAWLNVTESASSIYASIWDGSGWSVPVPISTAAMADGPGVSHASDGPMVVWAQDTDGDPDTFDDWRLYASVWDGLSWSSPSPIETGEATQPVEADSRRNLLYGLGLRPPEECCEQEGEDGDGDDPLPPDPPDSLKRVIGGGSSPVIVSIDPNEKVGPGGEGDLHAVNARDPLRYEVYFENQPGATAPAQEVFVIDCLDPHLDWMTARLEEISFGEIIVTNPHESPVFYERVTIGDYREEEDKEWWVDIRAEYEVALGCLKVTLRMFDPETGRLPEDPFAGLLPPEDGTGRGQGYIVFSIFPKKDVKTGTVIKNQATIQFDTNEPILTNEVFNTVLNLHVAKVRPRSSEPGEVIKIIGHNFGDTQDDSVVHIGKETFDATSLLIERWTDTKIKIRVPEYECDSFKDKEFRRRKVWVTVDDMDSNKKRFKVMKPPECDSTAIRGDSSEILLY